ncbi:MAG: siderophore ABC transporter substrate-binding protein [Clostridium sp.]
MNKKIGIIIGAIVVSLIGGAILLKGNEKIEKEENNIEKIVVAHKVGETKVNKNPERIVVFDYAALDVIDNLNIEGVVGIPKAGTIPEYLSKYKSEEYANVGGLKEPDLEKIHELKPDLIIINGRQHSFYEKLSEIAPTISLLKEDGKYMESTKKNLNYLAQIFNKEEEINKELLKINEKIEEINKVVEEKDFSATTLMTSNGELSVFGKDSRFGIIYNELGFNLDSEDVKKADHGQTISYEYVKNQKSDYIFVIDKSAITKEKKTAKELLDNELIKESKAYKNGKLVYLDTVAWYISDGGITSTNMMLNNISDAIKK